MTNDMNNTFQDLTSACQEIERLKAELSHAMATPAFGKQMHYKLENESLTAENLRLKSDNARLAAALLFIRDECDWEASGDGGDDRIGPTVNKTLHEHGSALRDLLAPIGSLITDLERLLRYEGRNVEADRCLKQLARLRAACGEKEKK